MLVLLTALGLAFGMDDAEERVTIGVDGTRVVTRIEDEEPSFSIEAPGGSTAFLCDQEEKPKARAKAYKAYAEAVEDVALEARAGVTAASAPARKASKVEKIESACNVTVSSEGDRVVMDFTHYHTCAQGFCKEEPASLVFTVDAAQQVVYDLRWATGQDAASERPRLAPPAPEPAAATEAPPEPPNPDDIPPEPEPPEIPADPPPDGPPQPGPPRP